MPRQKSLITIIRDLVRQEISKAINTLMGGLTGQQGAGEEEGRSARAASGAGPSARSSPRGPEEGHATQARPPGRSLVVQACGGTSIVATRTRSSQRPFSFTSWSS